MASGGNTKISKPDMTMPSMVLAPSQDMAMPTTTVSRSVSKRVAAPDRAEDRDRLQAVASKSLDEMVGVILALARNEDVNANCRLRAATFMVNLAVAVDEVEVQTDTLTSHMNAITSLAMGAPKR